MHQCDTKPCEGPSQTSLQPFRLSMSVNSCRAQRTGSPAAPPCASCRTGRDRLSAGGTVESTHRQPIASPKCSPLLQDGASGTSSSRGHALPLREGTPTVTRTAKLRLDDAFSVGKTKNTSCFGKSPDPPWLALTVAGASRPSRALARMCKAAFLHPTDPLTHAMQSCRSLTRCTCAPLHRGRAS